MRCNGTIQIEKRQPSAVNEYGEPLPCAAEWGEPIGCSVLPNADTRLGRYEDGEFRQASYSVLVEGDRIEAERVRLSRCDERLGDFRVISIRPLALGRTQLLV